MYYSLAISACVIEKLMASNACTAQDTTSNLIP
jgi:hypothetical protein